MKKKRINTLKLVGLSLWPMLLMATGLFFFCKEETGFQVSKIKPSYEFSMRVNSGLSTEDLQSVKKILSQDFYYLGNGAQCYVFVSKDQEYVIKFFKIKHLTPKYWLNYIPLPWLDRYRFEKIDSRERKRYETFSSFKIAFEEFRQHTGLIFVHLAKTKNLHDKTCLIDKNGNRHQVLLDEVPFVLQKKAVVFYTYIGNLLKEGKDREAMVAIRSVLDLVQKRCMLGLADKDGGIGANYGFIDGQPAHIDVGRIIRDESLKDPLNMLRELFRVTKKMEVWIQRECPRLLTQFQEEIYDILEGYESMGAF